MATPAPRPEPTPTGPVPRDWLRLSFHAPKHPKVASLPSDAARWAWIVALSEAKQQTPDGEWASERHARVCLGAYAKHLPALIRVGLVDQHSDGRLTVHDYSWWQSPRSDHDATYRDAHRDTLAEKERARRAGKRAERGEAVASSVASGMVGNAYTETETYTGTPDPPKRDSVHLGVAPDDPRYPVARLLATRFRWRAVTEPQWERLWECVDNEYPRGTSRGDDPRAGWAWVARLMDGLSTDGGDPIEAVFAEVDRLQRERDGG